VRRPIAAAMLVLALSACDAAFGQYSGNGSIDPRAYKIVPADEDWSFLADPSLRSDRWDPIKYIPLRKDAKDWYLSIGGQIREDWERVVNDNWGLQPYNNHYLLERYILHLDAHYGEHFRTFVDFKSGISTGRIGGPRPIDEKRLDFASAFVEMGTGPGQDSMYGKDQMSD
jgi:hypothetical protein